jgi:hypothetical protein
MYSLIKSSIAGAPPIRKGAAGGRRAGGGRLAVIASGAQGGYGSCHGKPVEINAQEAGAGVAVIASPSLPGNGTSSGTQDGKTVRVQGQADIQEGVAITKEAILAGLRQPTSIHMHRFVKCIIPKIFYKAVNRKFMALAADLAELSAVEDILMIGYPIGLWDEHNNFPIAVIAHPVCGSGSPARVKRMARRGSTALRRAVSRTERISA